MGVAQPLAGQRLLRGAGIRLANPVQIGADYLVVPGKPGKPKIWTRSVRVSQRPVKPGAEPTLEGQLGSSAASVQVTIRCSSSAARASNLVTSSRRADALGDASPTRFTSTFHAAQRAPAR